MSKRRKSKNSQNPEAATPDVAQPAVRPKRAKPAVDLAGSEGAELQTAAHTETRLPELPPQEAETKLPPAPPAELESKPAPAPHLAEPKPDVAPPVEAQAEVTESANIATGAAKAAAPSPPMDGPRRAIAGMEACQTLFMDMTRDNLDLAASIASMRSPLDLFDVATKYAGRRIGTYGRFSRAIVDIAAKGQSPRT
jgi:hypothetical protein